MQYEYVFWDVDETLSDPNLCTYGSSVPYEGLRELILEVGKDCQGVISNGMPGVQRKKLRQMGLYLAINEELIFTSFEEARKIVKDRSHPLFQEFVREVRVSEDIDSICVDEELACVWINEEYCRDFAQRIAKPEPYMFQRALEKTGSNPNSCLMIGDEGCDIVGANKAGMDTALWIPSTRSADTIELAKSVLTPTYCLDAGDVTTLRKIILG